MRQCRIAGLPARRTLETVTTRSPARVLAAVLLAATVLTGCAGHGDDDAAPDPNTPPVTMLYSPNGEPLNGGPLGRPTCREALSGWFDRLASPPDGVITQAAFLADARTQFRRMDIDGNGYLVPEELARFRLPYRQPLPAGHRHQSDAQADDTDGTSHQGRHHASGESEHGSATAPGHGARDEAQPDPVMSADTGLDFKVSLDAFLIQANATFAKLDINHNGHLTQVAVLGLCDAGKRQE
jgi:hypothetical protein